MSRRVATTRIAVKLTTAKYTVESLTRSPLFHPSTQPLLLIATCSLPVAPPRRSFHPPPLRIDFAASRNTLYLRINGPSTSLSFSLAFSLFSLLLLRLRLLQETRVNLILIHPYRRVLEQVLFFSKLKKFNNINKEFVKCRFHYCCITIIKY